LQPHWISDHKEFEVEPKTVVSTGIDYFKCRKPVMAKAYVYVELIFIEREYILGSMSKCYTAQIQGSYFGVKIDGSASKR